MSFTQSNREATVVTALADDVLLFAGMQGNEQLGRLSEFRVQLLSTDSNLRIRDILGKPLTVTLRARDGAGAGTGTRYFNGIVTRFACTGWRGEFAAYEATVHPWLWLLTRSSNCRIFQDLSLLDIVKQVCEPYGGAVSLSARLLSGQHGAPLAYCVQYRESDFDFVCRLLEQAGVYFYFTHEAGRHTMELADSYRAHQPIAGYDDLRFSAHAPQTAINAETIWDWRIRGAITASRYVLGDFDFEKAGGNGLRAAASIAAAHDQASYEMYDYPGNYKTPRQGDELARALIESQHGEGEQVSATTDARGLFPGGLFRLAEHPREDQNRDYLVTAASYDVTGHDYTSGNQVFAFSCHITAIGKQFAYRPTPITPRPVVQGPQTAMVVGKAGEEIWTDKYGRVKVQFHWDRLGREDEHSSCWVRVAHGWAGKGWGAMSVPRIGMEVVVSFLEGDPDRPLVTGCVYNANAMPPYSLPEEQTVSTFKSRSSKGGDGFNELRFEDARGEEEIYLHAERDFLREVNNNDTLKVGFGKAGAGIQKVAIKSNRIVTIGHDAIDTIGNDQVVTVKADHQLDVGGNQASSVKGDYKLDVGGDQALTVGGDRKVKVGASIVIEAGDSIELKVGASSIRIDDGKITIQAQQIAITSMADARIEAGGVMAVNGAVMQIKR